MRNRNDRLSAGPNGLGWRCEWEYSRTLHVCDVFPTAGRWLLQRALREWPIDVAGDPAPFPAQTPLAVTFIIGHRGLERLPHLKATLETIRRQIGVGIECIVVEQDAGARVRAQLPEWVRYVWAPLPGTETRYSRAAAFNAGARQARGEVLILHDNDMLVPRAYAAEVWRRYRQGYEACQFGRFIFYLDSPATKGCLTGSLKGRHAGVERVVENSAGGSVAVSRAAFESIGGMDEGFIGWGGEDNEFWERCRTRKTWDYGYMLFVHLWHPSRADRAPDNPALALWDAKRKVPVDVRIRALGGRCRSIT